MTINFNSDDDLPSIKTLDHHNILMYWFNRKSVSKECIVYYYWYFLDKRFKFPLDVCNGCHDILMVPMNLSDITLLNNYGVDCCCIINEISKNEAMGLSKKMQICMRKVEYYIRYKNFLSCIKYW